MAYQLQIVLFCASLLAVTVIGRPQVWNIGFNPNTRQTPTQATPSTPGAEDNQDPNANTSAAPPVQATTPSKKFYDCMAGCPVTSEYNPICGSDGVNYHNLGRLNCAAGCGVAVTMVRAGTCMPAG